MWPFRKRYAETEHVGNWFINFMDLFRSNTTAGTSVTTANAIELPAVYRCWTLNADTVSCLPVDVVAKRGDRREPYRTPTWLEKPNDDQTLQQFLHVGQMSYEADGNIFILKAVDGAARIVGLEVLDPRAVTPRRVTIDGQPYKVYDITTANGTKTVASTSIIHIYNALYPGTLRGISPIMQVLFETIGTAKAAQEFAARFFGAGATLSGVIEATTSMTQEQVERLKDDFAKKHGGVSKSHAIGILSGGATFKPLSVKPEESQFIETRRMSDVQIANVYGVPPEYVTEADGAKGYVTGLYMRQAMWLITGINPRLKRWEDALSALLPRPARVKFNRNAMLVMSPQERSQFYDSMQMGERMSVDEIRALEDLNPYGGEYDKPLKSVQWIHATDPPPNSGTDPDNQARAERAFSWPEVGA